VEGVLERKFKKTEEKNARNLPTSLSPPKSSFKQKNPLTTKTFPLTERPKPKPGLTSSKNIVPN